MRKYTKILLTLITGVWLASCGQSQQNDKAADNEIRKATQAYQEAFNQQDASKLAALWASDANYINPVTGETADGREAIEKLYKDKFAQDKDRHLEISVKSVELLNPDEAVERGVMKVTTPDQPAKKVAYAVGYVKENGKWLVNDINEIELLEAPDNSEYLKDLAWLIGKWEDSDDNVEITFDNSWDKNKNFIIQHFDMKVYGQDDIEGRQLIAWDPVNEVIRSWVFDTDGSFGEGTWEKVDNSWYATMKYTLGDGRVASSKNIYTPVDDHTYTFASVEREVDGDILPDMNPVNVEKAE